jgi:hypothetical protein
MDNQVMAWTLVLISVTAFGALLYWLNDAVSKARRMMRCPETETITFVRVARAAESSAKVVQCELWPERKSCTQGCLARYHEPTSGLHVNLYALRPFKPQ